METADQQVVMAVERLLAEDRTGLLDLRDRVTADLDAGPWSSLLGDGPHRLVVVGRLLELVDPGPLLDALSTPGVLTDDGAVVLEFRDATHPELVAALRDGRTAIDGILDGRQRSWFSPDSLRVLLHAHGFVVDRSIAVDPSPEPRRHVVRARRSGTAGELAVAADRIAGLERERERLAAEVARARALLVEEREMFDEQVAQGALDIDSLRRRNDHLRAQLEKARARRDEVRERRDQAIAQRDQAKKQREKVAGERDRARAEVRRLHSDLERYAGSRWVRANRRLVGGVRRLRGGGR